MTGDALTPSAKGTNPIPIHVSEYSTPYDLQIATPYSRVQNISLGDTTPNIHELCVFDGDTPMCWKKSSEKYFKLFHTNPHTWKDYATI
jgi:hypothetical protein